MDSKKIRPLSISPAGIAAAIIFACGPFMYANIAGRGLFIYLAVLFFGAILLQALAFNDGKILVKFEKWHVFYFVMLLWQVAAFIASPGFSFDNAYQFLKIVLLYCMLTLIPYTSDDKKIMIFAHTAIALIAVTSMIVSAVSFTDASERISFSFFGVSQDPNYMCFFLLIPIIFLLSYAFDQEKKNLVIKLIFAGLAIYLLYGILNTGSRGGLIASIVGIAVALFVQKKIGLKIVFWIGGAVLLVSLFGESLLELLPESVSTRFSIERLLEDGGAGRSDIWIEYLQYIFSDVMRFLGGSGNSSSTALMNMAAHNYLIEIFFEYGLIGVIFSALFYWNLIKSAHKKKKFLAFSSLFAILMLTMTLTVSKIMPFWVALSLASVMATDDCPCLTMSLKRKE